MKIAIPHRKTDARYSLNFFRSLSGALGFEKSRSEELAFRTLLLASMTNGYVENTSQVTGACGQTVRNHLRDRKPDAVLQINRDMIATLREMGILKKPLIVALDWHDEMYYGSLETEGIVGTKNKAGTNYAYEYATVSIVVKRLRFAVAVIPVKKRSILDHGTGSTGHSGRTGNRDQDASHGWRILLGRCNNVPDILRYSVHNACPETREDMRKHGNR